MPTSCCAIGCANRYRKGSNVKFYRFPTDALRRDLWVSASVVKTGALRSIQGYAANIFYQVIYL